MAKAKPAAQKSLQIYRLSPKKLTDRTTRKWDGGYYSEKLKQNYLILTTKIKALFPIRKVLNGAFTIKLYGLTFTEVFDIDKYHPEVMTYEVTDDKKRFSGCFYADFFPRKGKRNGAWMTSFKGQYIKDDNERPHISNVCNFTKPTENPLY
jgi:peptidyl-dipeptidase Dcp